MSRRRRLDRLYDARGALVDAESDLICADHADLALGLVRSAMLAVHDEIRLIEGIAQEAWEDACRE